VVKKLVKYVKVNPKFLQAPFPTKPDGQYSYQFVLKSDVPSKPPLFFSHTPKIY
jgi:hypothetical protein